jgi:hypothetical protein
MEVQVRIPKGTRTVSDSPRVGIGIEVNLPSIRRVRVRVGVLLCPDRANVERERDGVLHLAHGSVISCGGQRGGALDFQTFATGEAATTVLRQVP